MRCHDVSLILTHPGYKEIAVWEMLNLGPERLLSV